MQQIVMEQPGLLTTGRKTAKARAAVAAETGQDDPRLQPRCKKIAHEAHRVFIWGAIAGLTAFTAWASLTELNAVTRGMGTIVPSLANQIVQHLEGGIVAEIMVKEGAHVTKGQALVRLEDRRWMSSREQANLELQAKRAKLLRLTAQAEGADSLDLPPDLDNNDFGRTERAYFRQQKLALTERNSILKDQIRRQELELSSLDNRLKNIHLERGLIKERVDSLSDLADKGAVSRNDLLSAMSMLQQLDTKLSDISYQIPQVKAELSETKGRLDEQISTFRAAAAEQRAALELEIGKWSETIAMMDDREDRAYVRSPVTGTINKIFVATIGGIVDAGQPIAEIVPANNELAIEVELGPEDRAKVWPGMPAVVKITAYDYSIYGGLEGEVVDISPDALKDQQGRSYFRVRLTANADELGEGNPVLPGMVANVDMISHSRTILQYLLAPLTKMRDEAFRE